MLAAGILAVRSEGQGATAEVTVAQLEQFLAGQRAAHAGDGATAQKLRSVELSERLTELTLARLKAQYQPGDETAAELDVLADLSAFLDPPESEVSGESSPSAAEQQAMIGAARKFVTGTLSRLPDFLATRTTRSFEDVPVFTADSSFQSGMHLMGTYVRQVAFRNGREFATDTDSADSATNSHRASPAVLNSAGEFGPILATIMEDSAHGGMSWSGWEATSAGPAAVFRYGVAKAAAHYEIKFCCAWNSAKEAFDTYDGTPAYHGTITLDPSNGAILGLTLEADFDNLDEPPQFGLLVRYGAVEIEGKSLMCPLRSAVIVRSTQTARKRIWDVVHVNDMMFTGYRRFGSTARVLAKTPAP
jgi:hypothetical protein